MLGRPLIQRHTRIGRRLGGEPLGIRLQELPAGDVIDLAFEELPAPFTNRGEGRLRRRSLFRRPLGLGRRNAARLPLGQPLCMRDHGIPPDSREPRMPGTDTIQRTDEEGRSARGGRDDGKLPETGMPSAVDR